MPSSVFANACNMNKCGTCWNILLPHLFYLLPLLFPEQIYGRGGKCGNEPAAILPSHSVHSINAVKRLVPPRDSAFIIAFFHES